MDRLPIDLRSDTVTKPTPEMRRAMAEAEVGDDVFEEDPTVRRLEEMAAGLIGTESAIFVPTGTMGNQVALHLHARPGREVILESRSHVLNYEMAAMAVLSGLLPRAIVTGDGMMTAAQVEAAVMPDVSYRPRTGLVVIENTHNFAGGKVMPLARSTEIQVVARRNSLPVHLDGARIFNAAAFLALPVAAVAAGYDSVMFCLSKGLGAPAGSLLCGSAPFVREARRVRKMLGGGMRQVGVLAAAGIVALGKMVDRIAEDHDAAAALAEGLATIEGLEVAVRPETNIVIFRVRPDWFATPPADGATAAPFLGILRQRGVLASSIDRETIRFVTHFDLPAGAVAAAVEASRPGAR